MNETIVVAIIGLIGIVATAYIGPWLSRRTARETTVSSERNSFLDDALQRLKEVEDQNRASSAQMKALQDRNVELWAMWEKEREIGEAKVKEERKKTHDERDKAHNAVTRNAQLEQLVEDMEREHAATVARMIRDCETETQRVKELSERVAAETAKVRELESQIGNLQLLVAELRGGATA